MSSVFSLQSASPRARRMSLKGTEGTNDCFFCPQLSVFVRSKVGVFGVGEDRLEGLAGRG